MFEFNETMYGKKVKFIDENLHEEAPQFYPSVGTIGTITHNEVNYDLFDDGPAEPDDWMVQWPEGSTSGNDMWYIGEEFIELAEENSNENE